MLAIIAFVTVLIALFLDRPIHRRHVMDTTRFYLEWLQMMLLLGGIIMLVISAYQVFKILWI